MADLEGPLGALDLQKRAGLGAIDAEVILAGSEDVRWPARVTGVASSLDPTTRNVRVVVTVDAPYDRAQLPERPAFGVGCGLAKRNREKPIMSPRCRHAIKGRGLGREGVPGFAAPTGKPVACLDRSHKAG